MEEQRIKNYIRYQIQELSKLIDEANAKGWPNFAITPYIKKRNKLKEERDSLANNNKIKNRTNSELRVKK